MIPVPKRGRLQRARQQGGDFHGAAGDGPFLHRAGERKQSRGHHKHGEEARHGALRREVGGRQIEQRDVVQDAQRLANAVVPVDRRRRGQHRGQRQQRDGQVQPRARNAHIAVMDRAIGGQDSEGEGAPVNEDHLPGADRRVRHHGEEQGTDDQHFDRDAEYRVAGLSHRAVTSRSTSSSDALISGAAG